MDCQEFGTSVESETCNDMDCPVFEQWTNWTSCSRSCNGGNQRRNRACSTGRITDCKGSSVEFQECAKEACPEWKLWQQWSECSKSCGNGVRNRVRPCSTGRLVDCFGDSVQQQPCRASICPTSEPPKTLIARQREPSRFANAQRESDTIDIKVEELDALVDDLDKNKENGFGLFSGNQRRKTIARGNRFDSKYDYESYYDGEYGNYYYEETYGQAAYDPTIQMPFKNKVEDPKIYERTGRISCWRCDGSSSWEDCWTNGEFEQCTDSQSSCQLTVRRRGADFWINTGCKQASACEVNKSQNFVSETPINSQCDPSEEHSVCRQCCYDHGCNHEWAPLSVAQWAEDHSPNATTGSY